MLSVQLSLIMCIIENSSSDIFFMDKALELAKRAFDMGEVPVGAVVVRNGEIIGKGYNLRENLKSAVSHAEVLAIEEACRSVGSWRLSGCTLYVTMEPCPMCAGTLVNSRIDRVVFGCKDRVAGCLGSVMDFRYYPINHSFSVQSGVREEECAQLLKSFFDNKRKKY